MQSSFHEGALLFEFTRKTFQEPFPLPTVIEDLAQFLLVRGKVSQPRVCFDYALCIVSTLRFFCFAVGPQFAWLGHNWMGCFTPENEQLWVANIRPKEVDLDYGEPVDEYCKETSAGSGVFVREWSKAGKVEME